METLVQLGQQYKGEFEERYEGIRKRGAEQIQQAQDTVQQIQPELESKQHEFVALVQDTVGLFNHFTQIFYIILLSFKLIETLLINRK